MDDTNPWQYLQHITARGVSEDRVFTDWLELMLTARLSLTDNVGRGNTDFTAFDGQYEARYMETVKQYQPEEARQFSRAYGALQLAIENADDDILGNLYMAHVSSGSHGQYFTPSHVADFMAEAVTGNDKPDPCVYDPCCGSGALLLQFAKRKPQAILTGVDIDRRCAVMCVLNIALRGYSGHVYHGNTLTGEMTTCWLTADGWITEDTNPSPFQLPAEEAPQLPQIQTF